jgi:hypothetical protein
MPDDESERRKEEGGGGRGDTTTAGEVGEAEVVVEEGIPRRK